jgi:hypothetical protein
MASSNKIIWTVSIIASIWLTFIYYPGVLFSDTYARWGLVHHIIHSGGSNKFTIVPGLWMTLTYYVSQNFGLFTLLQSFLFFYSSFYLIQIMGNFRNAWILLPVFLFISFPLFQGYSVFQENSIGTVIGINFMLILFSHKEEELNEIRKLGYFFVCFLIFSSAFGFRQNSITMLPLVIFILWKEFRIKKIKTTIQAWALVVALVFVYALPDVCWIYKNISKLEEFNLALTWETAQVIKKSHDPKYDHYLDYLGVSPDSTKNALTDIEEGIWGHLIKDEMPALSFYKIVDPKASERIRADYVKLVSDHPKAFFENRIYNWGRVLGLSRPLSFNEFYENRWDRLGKYGYRFTELRRHQFLKIEGLMNKYEFLSRPFIIFIFGGIVFFIGQRYLRNDVQYLGRIFLFTVFYYAAFFIITENYEFRYYFPVFYLISIMALVILTKFIQKLSKQGIQKHVS